MTDFERERMTSGVATRDRNRYGEASLQTMRNTAFGMSVRLEGMKRRNEPQEKIDALKAQHEELTNKIKEVEKS